MALEAVVYQQDFLGTYNGSLDINNWGSAYESCGGLEKENNGKGYSFEDQYFLENQTESYLNGDYWNNSTSSSPPPPSMVSNFNEFYLEDANANANGSSILVDQTLHEMDSNSTCIPNRPKRRRAKSRKNLEEIENQRRTHIAVERNRRKQMNEYLSVLRSLMPESYVQRGDQASIIGGAINFVKELEHTLKSLGAQKEIKEKSESGLECSPFAEFFTFPQYSTSSTSSSRSESEAILSHETQNSIADIEVNTVESHANLKIRSKRRPKQLLKMVSGLYSMHLTILHLNATTDDEMVLYSLSVKVEDDCNLTSGDDIATAVYQLLGRIQEDALLN